MYIPEVMPIHARGRVTLMDGIQYGRSDGKQNRTSGFQGMDRNSWGCHDGVGGLDALEFELAIHCWVQGQPAIPPQIGLDQTTLERFAYTAG